MIWGSLWGAFLTFLAQIPHVAIKYCITKFLQKQELWTPNEGLIQEVIINMHQSLEEWVTSSTYPVNQKIIDNLQKTRTLIIIGKEI